MAITSASAPDAAARKQTLSGNYVDLLELVARGHNNTYQILWKKKQRSLVIEQFQASYLK